MLICLSLILLMLLFPNITMSCQTILLNHLVMMTVKMLNWPRVYRWLILCDMVMTQYSLKLTVWRMRQKSKSYFITLWHLIDMFVGNLIYGLFKKSYFYITPNN